ncbi:hypothetical protein D3C86_1029570 [compost metagenome]
MSFMEPPRLLNGTPSITVSGPVPALIEFTPLTNTVGELPGTDEVEETFSPAVVPSMAESTLVTGRSDNLSFGTEVTDPVISERFCVPYPTTTTSFIWYLPSSINMVTLITDLLPTLMFCET